MRKHSSHHTRRWNVIGHLISTTYSNWSQTLSGSSASHLAIRTKYTTCGLNAGDCPSRSQIIVIIQRLIVHSIIFYLSFAKQHGLKSCLLALSFFLLLFLCSLTFISIKKHRHSFPMANPLKSETNRRHHTFTPFLTLVQKRETEKKLPIDKKEINNQNRHQKTTLHRKKITLGPLNDTMTGCSRQGKSKSEKQRYFWSFGLQNSYFDTSEVPSTHRSGSFRSGD